jgi:DNA-binding NarL/FixJ family response regulator
MSTRIADVVVTAVERLTKSELAELRALRGRLRQSRVVVVVDDVTPGCVHAAFDAGADAVVDAPGAEQRLAAAIRSAQAELASFPREVRVRFARPALSTREKQVLGLVVLGYTNSEISTALHIAETTVKTHLGAIFEKLGVRSRNEARSLVLDPVRGHGLGVLAITSAGGGDERAS